MPPINLKVTNSNHIEEAAQPTAERRYKIAITINTFFRPYFWAGLPAMSDPITVPIKLEATVKPCQNEVSCQSDWMVFSAPEITAVSNPNKKPPNAAITAIRMA
jgi:hypothetical protein